jgi:hypothetical protein
LTFRSFFPPPHPYPVVALPGQILHQPEFWSIYTNAAMMFFLLSALVFLVTLLVTNRAWLPAGKRAIAGVAAAVALIPLFLGKSALVIAPIQDRGVSPGLDHLVSYLFLGLISALIFGTAQVILRRVGKTRKPGTVFLN